MKSTYLILILPILLFAGAAAILDPVTLLPTYSDADLTPYLAAVSLAKDGDLAYTREDSDRYLRKYDSRPSPFRVLQKKMMTSKGQYQSYYAFAIPELFVFVLAPFVGLLGFRGWLVLHALILLCIYVMGWLYYRGKDQEALAPAINSVVYFTLLPLPVVFLLPSHHLFLFAVITAFLFFGLRGSPVISAIFLAVAFSLQFWSVVLALFLIVYWQVTKVTRSTNPIPRFVIALTIALFTVWGLERLMYPVANVSETRWITSGSHLPLATIWQSLPVARTYDWTAPELQRIVDFLFGRNSGFFVYAFVPAALLLSSLWVFGDPLVRTAWLFVLFYVGLLSTVHPSSWNAQSFVHDFWILLSPFPFFVVPLIRPKRLFVVIATLAAVLIGPLLVNPLGAIRNHSDYTYSFPYRFFPVEVSLAGRAGITNDLQYQQPFPGGNIYFLNDSFYMEKSYFWLRGESTLEFLLELKSSENVQMEFRNGVLENRVRLKFRNSEKEIRLTTAEVKKVNLTPSEMEQIRYEGRHYVHGEIQTNAGYVPGLLSRDNPDYRFLSCQIQINP